MLLLFNWISFVFWIDRFRPRKQHVIGIWVAYAWSKPQSRQAISGQVACYKCVFKLYMITVQGGSWSHVNRRCGAMRWLELSRCLHIAAEIPLLLDSWWFLIVLMISRPPRWGQHHCLYLCLNTCPQSTSSVCSSVSSELSWGIG